MLGGGDGEIEFDKMTEGWENRPSIPITLGSRSGDFVFKTTISSITYPIS
jgi:hypothetical protein